MVDLDLAVDTTSGEGDDEQVSTAYSEAALSLGVSRKVTSSADSGPGSLRDVISKAQHGDLVYLGAGVNPVIANPITITKQISIVRSRNPADTELKAFYAHESLTSAAMFRCSSGKVRFGGIDFRNAQQSAITGPSGRLEVVYSSFYDCAVDGDGGAIRGNFDEVYIFSALFQNCTASGNGGAIKAKKLEIYESTFANCRAESGAGGGTYCTDGPNAFSDVHYYDCRAGACSASHSGSVWQAVNVSGEGAVVDSNDYTTPYSNF